MSSLAVFLPAAMACWLLSGPARLTPAMVRALPSGSAPGPADGSRIDDLPMLLELLGAALDAGVSVPRALKIVAAVAAPEIRDGLAVVVAGLSIGASWEHAWEPVRGSGALAGLYRALSLAALTGAPAASLLYAESAQLRRGAHRDAERRAGALGVKLVIPLGLCSLPAFVCLGVVPVVVAMMPAL
ncbi:type II secretion system F family protein [Specibacter cremeus]|uniref:type II secretion system F family protein n=1 Tax=Specibacter cremeus TaxID=1629051 RepID=UPI001F0C23A4|nr:type II secretion system F family protein [Specibacter cremeus]